MHRLRILLPVIAVMLCITVSPVSAKKLITANGTTIDLSFVKDISGIFSDIRAFPIRPPVRTLTATTTTTTSAIVQQQEANEQTEIETEPASAGAPLQLSPKQNIIPVIPPPATSESYTMSIPKLSLENIVVTPSNLSEEVSWRNALKSGLAQALFHPGMGHKILIFGHSSRLSWDVTAQVLFQNLNDLEAGDRIYLTYKAKNYTYEVSKKEVVAPNTPSIMQDYNWEELVLFTCYPINTDRNRLIIYTVPVTDE